MSIAFKAATTAANTILANDKRDNAKKLDWKAMSFASMPDDIKTLAVAALQAQYAANEAKAALQQALDDKVEAPSGKRLIVTLGRRIDENTDGVLVAWATASAGGTQRITFDQFIKG